MIVLTLTGLYWGVTYYFMEMLTELGHQLDLDPNHVFFQVIHKHEFTMHMVFGVTALAGVHIAVVWGLLFSHSIAGPLYRLNYHLQAAARGKKVGLVRFRKGDYFPELAESLNDYLKHSGHLDGDEDENEDEGPTL